MAASETRYQQSEKSRSIPVAMVLLFTNAHLGSSAVSIVQVQSSFCGRCQRIIVYHGPIIDTPDAKKRRALPGKAMNIITLSLISDICILSNDRRGSKALSYEALVVKDY